MTDLNTLLSQNPAPAARNDLAARILTAAETAGPANDTETRRPWIAIGGVAAMAIMATLFFVQPSLQPETEWDQIAEVSGFSELYEWVEGEDS